MGKSNKIQVEIKDLANTHIIIVFDLSNYGRVSVEEDLEKKRFKDIITLILLERRIVNFSV